MYLTNYMNKKKYDNQILRNQYLFIFKMNNNIL